MGRRPRVTPETDVLGAAAMETAVPGRFGGGAGGPVVRYLPGRRQSVSVIYACFQAAAAVGGE